MVVPRRRSFAAQLMNFGGVVVASYIVRRILGALVVLLGVSIITFLIAYAVPADPARAIVGPHAPEYVVLQIRHQLGLDEPLPIQYLHFLWNLLHGNLGTSYVLNQSVNSLIGQRIGATGLLAGLAFVFELVIGIPIGILTGLRDRKLTDHILGTGALIGISLPVFFVGLELMFWVGFKLGWLPIGGSGGIAFAVLPALTYAITGAAYYARLLKSSMIDVLNQDYIRTARAKGASPMRVVMRHALRNALIPALTYAGTDVAMLLGGVVVIEDIFGYSGIGQLAFQAIGNLDVPLIMGTVLFATFFVVIFNLIVDILYGIIDPRISYS